MFLSSLGVWPCATPCRSGTVESCWSVTNRGVKGL